MFFPWASKVMWSKIAANGFEGWKLKHEKQPK
jgi:hypothetical protein